MVHFGVPVNATDTLVGVSNTTATLRGTIAFAALFFGPLTSNHLIDKEGFSLLQAEFTGEVNTEDPIMQKSTVAFYRRNVTLATDADGKPKGYDANRNLTRDGLHEPKGNECGSKFVECVPGPCSIWEYDYQFAGLQMSQVGPVESRVLSPQTVLDISKEALANGSYFDGFKDHLYYPMVGTVRCGPLFNYQYIRNLDKNGNQFIPLPSTSSNDEFDITSVLEPKDDEITQETLDYLPTVFPEPRTVYPIPGQALVPVPHGINMNPRWYYTGFRDCFPTETKTCSEETLLANWMYNTNPTTLQCDKMTKPPPYAPSNPLTPDDTTGPWTPSKATAKQREGPHLNEDPALFPYTGNPRLQKAVVTGGARDGHQRAALVGYVRGFEDSYITGESENVSYPLYAATSDEKYDNSLVTLQPQHWPNGRGPNHRITPQEIPDDYEDDPYGTCDFTQCRWVPSNANHKMPNEENLGKLDFPVAPSSAYAVLASELAIPPFEPLLDNAADCNNATNMPTNCNTKVNYAYQMYDRELAWKNRIRNYGFQNILFLHTQDIEGSYNGWIENPVLTEMYRSTPEVTAPDNVTVAFLECDITKCAPDLNKTCPEPFQGTPCTLEYNCNTASNTSNAACYHDANGTLVQPLCCATFAPFSIPKGGQHGQTNNTSPGPLQRCISELKTAFTDADWFDTDPSDPRRLDCQNFYARDANFNPLQVLTNNGHDDSSGMCNYEEISDIIVPLNAGNPSVYKKPLVGCIPKGRLNKDCYAMLGSYIPSNPPKKTRQAVVADRWVKQTLSDTKSPLEFSRVSAFAAGGRSSWKTGVPFDAPRFPQMQCVDDQNAHLYELGSVMRYRYKGTKEFEELFDVRVRFSYRHNMIPTIDGVNRNLPGADAQRMFSQNVTPVDGWFPGEPKPCPIMTFDDNEGQFFLDPKSKSIPSDSDVLGIRQMVDRDDHCGMLVLQTSHTKPKPIKGNQYRPLKAYYQETRAVFPNAKTKRSAAFLNSNEATGSWACDCNKQAIVWRWLAVPDDNKIPAPKELRQAQTLFSASEVVIRSFSWKNLPALTTPEIGLFLPSSQPTVIIRERDFFNDLGNDVRTDPENLLLQRLPTIEKRFGQQDAPGLTELPDMVFNGSAAKDRFRVFSGTDLKFTAGSCLRWPYGQVPRLGLTPEDRNTLYPDDSKRTYGLEAAMAYCETISPHRNGSSVGFSPEQGKLQACNRDPLSPAQRHQFCTSNAFAALHIIYGLQIKQEKRTIDHICSTEHRTCLVVPGRRGLGSLESVLYEHFRVHRNTPGTGDNYTFFVTPFNDTVFGLLLGNRHTAKVAQGVDFQTADDASDFSRLNRYDSNHTGLAEHPEVFSMLNNLSHSAEAIKDAVDALVRDLSNKTSGCPKGEFRIPGRSERVDATECITFDAMFKGSQEAGAVVRFNGSVIASASTLMPIKFQQVRNHPDKCVRIIVKGAQHVTIEDMEADQSNCNSPATAIVLNTDARAVNIKGLTVLGAQVASAVTVLTAEQGDTTDITDARITVHFRDPPPTSEANGFFRAALAASGATTSLDTTVRLTLSENNTGNYVVLLPAPNTTDINFTNGNNETTIEIINLRNSIAEFAHGTLKNLYSIEVVGSQSWTVTLVLTISLAIILALLIFSVVRDAVKAAKE